MRWIDMHCDTVSELYKKKEGTLMENSFCVDMKRLEQAGADTQFFACFVNARDYEKNNGKEACSETAEYPQEKEILNGRFCSDVWNSAYETVLSMILYVKSELAQAHVFSERKPVKAVLTVEEGGVLCGRLDRLEKLYEEGIRLVTLTWNYENCIGSPNSKDRTVMGQGLKPFGIEVVRRMNELGMLIDVSHLSDGGFYDCVKYSSAPIVASHSNARALCPNPRNLSDEMLRFLGEKGGVAGLNFYSAFIRNMDQRAELSDLARHAVWMIDKAGEDAVALGTDFDGFDRGSLPKEMNDVKDMEKVWESLETAGLSCRQIEKIAFGNIRRVMNDVL